MVGQTKRRIYFRQDKKIWSGRYATNCLSGIFEDRAAVNNIGIDDLPAYRSIMASSFELTYQNSHFQEEINSLKNKTA